MPVTPGAGAEGTRSADWPRPEICWALNGAAPWLSRPEPRHDSLQMGARPPRALATAPSPLTGSEGGMARRTVDAGQASFDARALELRAGRPRSPLPTVSFDLRSDRSVRFVFLFAAATQHRASSVHAAWSDSLLCDAPFAQRFRPGEIADLLRRHERK